jgi:hypothetical protein
MGLPALGSEAPAAEGMSARRGCGSRMMRLIRHSNVDLAQTTCAAVTRSGESAAKVPRRTTWTAQAAPR